MFISIDEEKEINSAQLKKKESLFIYICIFFSLLYDGMFLKGVLIWLQL